MNIKIWSNFIKIFQSFFRKKRGVFLKKMYPDLSNLKILDLGGTESFWIQLGIKINPNNITIINIANYQEEYSKLLGIKKIIYDGKKIPFKDKTFDLVICNSVLEHVPLKQRFELCAEIQRVSKFYFIQTPSFYFPIEPHFVLPFIHWLPKKIGLYYLYLSPWKILSKPKKKTINDYFINTNLLKESDLVELFKNSKIFKEKFLFITKSYYVCSKK